MKSRIITMLRAGILDKQGKAVQEALIRLGFEGILDVRIGKEYCIEHSKDCDMNKIAKTLYNEVMEDYFAEEIDHDNPSNPKNTHVVKRLE